MKLKTVLLLILSLLGQISISAQESRKRIFGTVVNTKGEPLEFINVTVRNLSDSTFITGKLTDGRGQFVFDSIPSPVWLVFSGVGYKTQRTKADDTEMRIALEENQTELSEVVVLGSYTTRKPSGALTVRMQGNPIAEGKNTMEALRYVQGVQVMNSNILVNGKEGTLIYLGDRLISSSELQAIPASMVKNVEIVSNPGIAYGKDAVGGIVKVTLREQQGMIGNAELAAQTDKMGLVDLMLSSAIQYQKGKFTLYNNLKGGGGTYRTRYDRTDSYLGYTEYRHSDTDKKEKAIIENIGMTYKISPAQTLSLYGGFYWVNDRINLENTTGKLLAFRQNDRQKFNELNAGLYYKLGLPVGEGSFFSAKVEYFRQNSGTDETYFREKEDNTRLDQTMDYLKADPCVELSFKDGSSLSAGFRFTRAVDNNRTDGIENPLLNGIRRQDFRISGGDNSPWIEYGRMFGKKLYAQAGASYLATDVRYKDQLYPAADYKVESRGLFANVQLQYVLNPAKRSFLTLAYKKDFSLPSYGYYSPLAIYQNEKLYSIGNQKLRKESFHAVELNWYVNPRWTITYRLRTGKDIIHVMAHQDAKNPEVVYTQPDNVGKLVGNYLSLSYTNRFFSRWNTNNLVYARHDYESMPELDVRKVSFGWSLDQQVQLRENLGLTLSFNGETPREKLSYKTGIRYGVDLGAYMTLLNNRMNISLMAANILHSENEMTFRTGGIEMKRIDVSPLTRLKLSVSWNFAAGDKIKRQKNNIVNSTARETPTL